jgi:hypothetical protein
MIGLAEGVPAASSPYLVLRAWRDGAPLPQLCPQPLPCLRAPVACSEQGAAITGPRYRSRRMQLPVLICQCRHLDSVHEKEKGKKTGKTKKGKRLSMVRATSKKRCGTMMNINMAECSL